MTFTVPIVNIIDLRCAPLNFVIELLKFSVRGHCAPGKKKKVSLEPCCPIKHPK